MNKHKTSVLHRALRYRGLDGVFTKTMDTLTGGPFLAGLALALGASNLQIGLIAAVPFLAKIAYIPAIFVVEHVGYRKKICVVSNLLARPLWLLIALSAWKLPHPAALVVLIVTLALISLLGTFSNLAWNAWMKDLLPDRVRGRMFSKRLMSMGAVGMVFSLAGALIVDWMGQSAQEHLAPLALLVAGGACAGLLGIFFLNRIPELAPLMGEHTSLRQALLLPLKDGAFVNLVSFSGSWAFATNLAVPFITVYMLKTLELSFSLVIAFTVASQLANLALLNVWGRLADRFGNKAVLLLCAPVFSLSLLLWTFTAKDELWLTLALIALIHVMNGMATAGIDVANVNLLYQLAPKRHATPYLASASLVNSLAAGVAPIFGGILGNAFAKRSLSIPFIWEDQLQNTTNSFTLVRLSHLDFVFVAAFFLGLFALKRLTRVKERAQEPRREHLVKSVKLEIQNISTIKGMRYLTQTASFFAGFLLESGSLLSPKHADATDPQDEMKR